MNRGPAARPDEMLAECAQRVPFYRELPDAAAVRQARPIEEARTLRQANRGTTT